MSSGIDEWGDESGYDLEIILATLGLGEEETLIRTRKSSAASSSSSSSKPSLLSADSLSKLELPAVSDVEENEQETSRKKKASVKRECIVREMHATEKSYTESLQTAIMLFLRPLRRLQSQPNPPASAQEVDRIFCNIEQLVPINTSLLQQMSARLSHWNDQSEWADIFHKKLMEPLFLSAYQEYIGNYPYCAEAVKSLSTKGSKFMKFVDRALVNDLCQNQVSLLTFLVTPVQRLPRYILFLKDLESCTDESHPDAANLKKALSVLTELTGKIHAAQDMYEQVSHVESLYNRFVGEDLSKVRHSDEPSRILIMEGPMLERTGAKYHVLYCILFSDCLVGATKARKGRLKLKWIINLNKCSFAETKDPESGTDFLLCTQEKREEFPYTVQSERLLTGIERSQYDAATWLAAFQSSCLTLHDDRAALARAAQATRLVLESSLFTQADWDKLLLGAKTHLFQTDELVYDGKEDSEWMAFVLSGRLQVQFSSEGSVIQLDTIGPRQFVGASPILQIAPQKWSATALEPASVMRVQITKMESVLASDKVLSSKFMHLLSLVYASRSLMSHLDEATLSTPLRTPSSRLAESDSESGAQGKKVKPNRANDKLLTKLGLPNETIVDSFPAKLKKSMFNYGTLVLMKENVAFVSKTFGHSTRIVIPGRCVFEVVSRNSESLFVNHIKASEPPLELAFKTEDVKDKAASLLSSFLSGKRVSRNVGAGVSEPTIAFSSSEREELMSLATSLEFKAGSTILAQGQICQYVYQLVEGDCAVYGLVKSELRRFGTVGKDELFGETSFLLGTVSSANVIAESDVTVLAFDRTKLENAFNESPGCSIGFYRVIARLAHKRIAKSS